MNVRPMNLHNLDRLHDERVSVVDRTRQSLGQGEYHVRNFYLPNPEPIQSVAANELTMIPRDGYGVGGRTIDAETSLKIGATQTRSSVPIHPQSRPIKTVPYMGGGRGNPYVESLLQKSEHIRDRKSVSTIMDSHFHNQFTPMIPQLARSIQDPHHYIEALNDPAWVRGGVISRNLVRDRLGEQENFRQ